MRAGKWTQFWARRFCDSLRITKCRLTNRCFPTCQLSLVRTGLLHPICFHRALGRADGRKIRRRGGLQKSAILWDQKSLPPPWIEWMTITRAEDSNFTVCVGFSSFHGIFNSWTSPAICGHRLRAPRRCRSREPRYRPQPHFADAECLQLSIFWLWSPGRSPAGGSC